MSQQPTVLIVEDDPVFRRVMNFTIARCGFTVETASDGQAAYQRLCQGGVDFLVTDHQMPICTGLELLEMLEANRDLVRPPAILCTAKGLELDSQGLQSRFGLAAVMHKPFSPRKLSELILQYIQADSSAPQSTSHKTPSTSQKTPSTAQKTSSKPSEPGPVAAPTGPTPASPPGVPASPPGTEWTTSPSNPGGVVDG